jgi:hypothetical protein
MSLLILRYHRARAGRRGNPARLLNAHFAHIAYCCANRMPGEPLAPGITNVCLSFDAGFYDFYAVVHPLLMQHDLRALLAVDPSCACEYSDRQPADRVALESDLAYADPEKGGFCTWSELRKMVAGGHVTIAARGAFTRATGLADSDVDVDVDAPRTILSARLSRPVESFVFCDGTCSAPALYAARQRYRFVFGNGGASNRDWHQRLLYRINADELASPTAPFSSLRRANYRARFWWNRLRER